MSMGNNSLQNYNKNLSPFTGAGTPANNFNRNHEATSVNRPGGLYMRYNNSNSIFGNYYSKDPITNFGDISYSNKKSAGEIITTIFAGLTGALGLVGTVASIVSLFQQNKQTNGVNNGFTRKESKEIRRNTENTTDINTAIDSTIETAQNLDENASVDTLMKASENLRNSITQATNQKNDAERNVSTATTTKKNLEKNQQQEQTVYDGLLNDKAAAEKELSTLEKADTSKMTPEQKAAHNKQISEIKQKISKIKKQIEKSGEKLQKLEKEIQVQQQIITNNTEVVNILESKILTANQSYEDLNKKIEEQNK